MHRDKLKFSAFVEVMKFKQSKRSRMLIEECWHLSKSSHKEPTQGISSSSSWT
jgi:hypothetical protein